MSFGPWLNHAVHRHFFVAFFVAFLVIFFVARFATTAARRFAVLFSAAAREAERGTSSGGTANTLDSRTSCRGNRRNRHGGQSDSRQRRSGWPAKTCCCANSTTCSHWSPTRFPPSTAPETAEAGMDHETNTRRTPLERRETTARYESSARLRSVSDSSNQILALPDAICPPTWQRPPKSPAAEMRRTLHSGNKAAAIREPATGGAYN